MFRLWLFLIFLSSFPFVRTQDDDGLVRFSVAEERMLDDGIRRSSKSRPRTPELVEFTDEEEEVLSHGWKAARHFTGQPTWRQNHIRPEDYCRHYRANYAYYCLGRTYGYEPLVQKITQFCPSYRNKCKHHASHVETDPFHVLQHRESVIDFPDVERRHRQLVKEQRQEEIERLHPCTPECNVRHFKHCTQDCKCDYLYPRVQRFCNPPPMPFFLNTCRLWYHGCPKYNQYNYASQFVYSAAEKGKTIGGGSPQALINRDRGIH
uniref:ShKT domain-containing protein n=1 Tax=Panagrellus redivivus TaxID=6233 RepID=A0A7E4VHF4_PANRE